MRFVPLMALLFPLLVDAPNALWGQTPGTAWWASPSHNRGLTAHATYSLTDGEVGKQRAGAVTLGYARDRLRFTATIGRAGSREDLFESTTVFGANGSWRIKRSTRPALNLDIQGGIGAASYDLAGGGEFSQLNLPLGVGLAFLGPAPIGSFELWVGTRAQVRRSRQEVAGVDAIETNVGGGASVGLEWTSLRGPGLHAGLDWLRIDSGPGDRPRSEWTVGFGIHFRHLPNWT